MKSEERDIYQGILDAREEERPCALATVVATRGSTPRKNGAKMLVDPRPGPHRDGGRGMRGGRGHLRCPREPWRRGIPRWSGWI